MPQSELHSACNDSVKVGYCTNVHAGKEFDQVLRNLGLCCDPIRQACRDDLPLGLGLWFSENAARVAIDPNRLAQLSSELRNRNLFAFTLNGFPQGDFHEAVVKHRVYLPEWWHIERLNYTQLLVDIMSSLIAPNETGSISTLPIAWSQPAPSHEQLQRAATHFVSLAMELKRLFETTGKRIVIAIEPEPGCYLTDSKSLRQFFDQYLSPSSVGESQSETVREYIGICHDICHAAVMFEDQRAELKALREAGIQIGKVQVSSAISIQWHQLSISEQQLALNQLRSFAEDRYLHQTHVRDETGTKRLIEDLPEALHSIDNAISNNEHIEDEWRIHFHVPIYLNQFDWLQSTQSEIVTCLRLLQNDSVDTPRFTGHYEIETYAWGVLPRTLQVSDLNQGIAMEVDWFRSLLRNNQSFFQSPSS